MNFAGCHSANLFCAERMKKSQYSFSPIDCLELNFMESGTYYMFPESASHPGGRAFYLRTQYFGHSFNAPVMAFQDGGPGDITVNLWDLIFKKHMGMPSEIARDEYLKFVDNRENVGKEVGEEEPAPMQGVTYALEDVFCDAEGGLGGLPELDYRA